MNDHQNKSAEEREAVRPGHGNAGANASQALRQQAECLLKRGALSPEKIEALSADETRKMLHELHVHQIELEMQNEELRESQLALERVRARYFDLYDLAPIGYCTVNGQGQIMQANLTIAQLLGMPRGALIKKPMHRCIVKIDQDIYYLCRKKLLETGEPQSCELRMVKNDGTQFWAQLTATAGQDVDGAFELRAVVIDISERKQVATELQLAMAAAKKANLAKSDFLSSMSHELRTPLNAILGFAQLIESGSPAPAPSHKRSLDQIIKGGWFLLNLINELLDLSSIESGRLQLLLEPVSLIDVIGECSDMAQFDVNERGIHLSILPFDNTWMIRADQTRIKRVLNNLISNATKYNQRQGSIEVKCTLSGAERIRVSVTDNGIGLPPEKLSQLFQPFNRLGQEAGAEEGTGIGLALCKRLVEGMGGTIGVESTVGVGSEFWFELIRDAVPPVVA